MAIVEQWVKLKILNDEMFDVDEAMVFELYAKTNVIKDTNKVVIILVPNVLSIKQLWKKFKLHFKRSYNHLIKR